METGVEEVIRFALLGLGLGALYALAAQGLIVGLPRVGGAELRLGATGMAGVYLAWELQYERGMAVFRPAAIRRHRLLGAARCADAPA